jgi:hypothetical protein
MRRSGGTGRATRRLDDGRRGPAVLLGPGLGDVRRRFEVTAICSPPPHCCFAGASTGLATWRTPRPPRCRAKRAGPRRGQLLAPLALMAQPLTTPATLSGASDECRHGMSPHAIARSRMGEARAVPAEDKASSTDPETRILLETSSSAIFFRRQARIRSTPDVSDNRTGSLAASCCRVRGLCGEAVRLCRKSSRESSGRGGCLTSALRSEGPCGRAVDGVGPGPYYHKC